MPRTLLSNEELQRVRGEAVAAAKRLFAGGGASALSFRSVAAETGFSTGGLYRYFPAGRDEILAAVRIDAFVVLDELLWKACHSATDPVDGLKRLSDALLRFATKHETEFALLFVYTEGDWEAFPELIERSDAAWRPLETVLQQGVDQGIFEGNARVLARAFYAAMMGMLTVFLSDDPDPLLSMDRLRESLFGLLIRGATPLSRLVAGTGN